MAQEDFSGIATATALIGTLAGSSGAGTVVSLQNATGWPTGATGIPFAGTFGRGSATEEKILFSSRSGNNLTIAQRGYDDTVAITHQNGEPVVHTVDATVLRTSSAHVFDTTRNDHPQYALLAAGSNTFAGQLLAKALNHYFGPGADGTTNQSRLRVQAFDATDVGIIGENSDQPNCNLVLRAKGTGTVNLQAPGGNTMFRAEVGGATPAASTAMSVECNGNSIATQRVVLGAADSAGTGYRTLRVPN